METKKQRSKPGWSVITAGLLTAAFLSLIIFEACKPKTVENPPPPTSDSAGYFAFRNSVTTPPVDYTGPVFQLSHDYPATLPPGGDQLPWLKINVDFNDTTPDFNGKNWHAYIMAIFNYCMRGQDPNLINEVGFRSKIDGKDAWFHVPWMAYNPSAGREYTHGCTSERVASLVDLNGDGDTEPGADVGSLPLASGERTAGVFETWAVGMYNEYAGYGIGQAFPKDGPNKGKAQTEIVDGITVPKGMPFANGSCVVKVLFTTATEQDAPYLKGSPEWTVDRHTPTSDTTFGCDRSLQTVRLLQMDVAVIDERSPTRWVFGTFGYNGTLPGATALERMDPIGIQFGNDPQHCPAVPSTSKQIYQSVINKQITIFEHLGCGKRLDGPVDNPMSSCMSCHSGAFTAQMDQLDTIGKNVPPIYGFPGICNAESSANQYYFANRKFPEPYGDPAIPAGIPLDFSLQMLVAFGQYKQYSLVGTPQPCYPSAVSHDSVNNTCK
jgi:hypothetical protein